MLSGPCGRKKSGGGRGGLARPAPGRGPLPCLAAPTWSSCTSEAVLYSGSASTQLCRVTAGQHRPPVLRSASRYRGVTCHMKTNRYESHVWDLGKQIYLGGFSDETTAALAYDLVSRRACI